MAKLVIQSEGFHNQVIHLKLGTNRFGRNTGNDFQIEHATISGRHCEILVSSDGMSVRDCGSTNGTFLGDTPVQESSLLAGQTLRLGDVQFLVESTDITIAIPEFEEPRPAPPVVLSDGGLLCTRHPEARVTHQCSHCREFLCDACVHRLRRRGGKLLRLCPYCSHTCTPLGGEKRKKKSLLAFLQKTVKLPFVRKPTEND